MNRLEVKTSKVTLVCLILLGLFFGLMSLANLFQLKHGFKIERIIWALVPLLVFSPVLWLVRRGHARSVKVFTEEGLTRNDGYRFSWADLSGVIHQIRRNPTTCTDRLWRTELHFNNNQSAWLIPSKIKNRKEVRDYVDALPCPHKEVAV
jgi:hypothetical protein